MWREQSAERINGVEHASYPSIKLTQVDARSHIEFCRKKVFWATRDNNKTLFRIAPHFKGHLHNRVGIDRGRKLGIVRRGASWGPLICVCHLVTRQPGTCVDNCVSVSGFCVRFSFLFYWLLFLKCRVNCGPRVERGWISRSFGKCLRKGATNWFRVYFLGIIRQTCTGPSQRRARWLGG